MIRKIIIVFLICIFSITFFSCKKIEDEPKYSPQQEESKNETNESEGNSSLDPSPQKESNEIPELVATDSKHLSISQVEIVYRFKDETGSCYALVAGKVNWTTDIISSFVSIDCPKK